MARVHNFSAGPAALPTSVLAEIADEMMDYHGCGMSVLEMSHRSSMYQQIIDDAEATLRRLLSIPDNYRVLFLQGGATLQFAGIPMNLMRRGRAGYVVTGNFANKAYKEAAKYGEAVLLASSEDANFDRIPAMADINARIAAEAAGGGLDYVYICQNNTIFGTMYHELPNFGDVPLVADVSSCFLSQPLDVERYGLIYAGAQKNAGAAGVTVVIVRDDLIADGPAFAQTPQYMDLKTQAAKGSMLNTPNTPLVSTCAARCSVGLSRPADLPPWPSATGPKPTCSMTCSSKANCSMAPRRPTVAPSPTSPSAPTTPGSTRPLSQARPSTRFKTSRAIAWWAACAPASTTPSPWRTCRRWPRT